MTAYERSEIIASGKLAKNLGAVLSSLSSGRANRVVISRHNLLEAVLLPVEAYEQLEQAFQTLEHIQIARTIDQRANERAIIPLETLLHEEGMDLDEI